MRAGLGANPGQEKLEIVSKIKSQDSVDNTCIKQALKSFGGLKCIRVKFWTFSMIEDLQWGLIVFK